MRVNMHCWRMIQPLKLVMTIPYSVVCGLY